MVDRLAGAGPSGPARARHPGGRRAGRRRGRRARPADRDRHRHGRRRAHVPRVDHRPHARHPGGRRASARRVLEIGDGVPLLLDGDAGLLVVDPGAEAAERFAASRREDERREAAARERAHEPAVTRDGRHVEVAANIGGAGRRGRGRGARAPTGWACCAPSSSSSTAPPRRTRRSSCASTGRSARSAGRRLVLRTLDAGADKPLRLPARLAARGEPVPRRARRAAVAGAPRAARDPAARGAARGRRDARCR